MVKAEWFKRYRENEVPERFDRIVQSWDTANKATELSDFSVCTTWGVKGKELFLLSVFRQRLEYPALKRAVRERQGLFGATVVLVEDKASGTQLIQELITDGCYGVTRYQPTADKIMRLHAQTAMLENGFVRIPEDAPWLAEYLHELTVFPNGKHDDQADSTAQFLDWCQKPFPGQGAFQFYRHASRAPSEPDDPERYRVHLQAPPVGPCRPSRAGTSTSATAPWMLPIDASTLSVLAGPARRMDARRSGVIHLGFSPSRTRVRVSLSASASCCGRERDAASPPARLLAYVNSDGGSRGSNPAPSSGESVSPVNSGRQQKVRAFAWTLAAAGLHPYVSFWRGTAAPAIAITVASL